VVAAATAFELMVVAVVMVMVLAQWREAVGMLLTWRYCWREKWCAVAGISAVAIATALTKPHRQPSTTA
jgi:hypothetical protein